MSLISPLDLKMAFRCCSIHSAPRRPKQKLENKRRTASFFPLFHPQTSQKQKEEEAFYTSRKGDEKGKRKKRRKKKKEKRKEEEKRSCEWLISAILRETEKDYINRILMKMLQIRYSDRYSDRKLFFLALTRLRFLNRKKENPHSPLTRA